MFKRYLEAHNGIREKLQKRKMSGTALRHYAALSRVLQQWEREMNQNVNGGRYRLVNGWNESVVKSRRLKDITQQCVPLIEHHPWCHSFVPS